VSVAGIESRRRLSTDEYAEVADLITSVTRAEGRRPLSDRAMLEAAHPRSESTTHQLARAGGRLIGYAQLTGGMAEIASQDPGVIRALVGALGVGTPDRLLVWAHGQAARTAAVLRELGFHEQRVLLQMRRSLTDPPLPEPEWPAGVTVRNFVVGADEAAWLAVNNAAFAHHPEQANWSMEDLTSREQEPWFDPEGFFLAERDGALVGFHWTKIHAPEGADAEPVGEVYIVGVAPAMQSQHLGTALTLAGLAYLAGRGLHTVLLYVDENNRAAVKVYQRLGFVRWDVDILFQR